MAKRKSTNGNGNVGV